MWFGGTRVTLACALALGSGCPSWGQSNGSASPPGDMLPADSLALRVKRTTLAAALLPGSGQLMNGQWWKVPVVWGGLGYAAWSTATQAREMRASVDDLVALTDNDPATVPVLTDALGNPYSEADLESRAYFYRRNRDLSVLSFLVIHGLQVLDANTGAMLRSFDTDDRLSVGWSHHFGVPAVRVTLRPFQPSYP